MQLTGAVDRMLGSEPQSDAILRVAHLLHGLTARGEGVAGLW
jgi:acetaldehyde dehydrogenase (acetylating)